MRKTIHFLVTGRVQGVFFRMYTRQQAEQNSISGWVRNLADGRVEGMASGDENCLQTFQNWLHKGPDMAAVTRVEVEELDYQDFEGFIIR